MLLQWRYQPPSRASWATIAANVIDAYIVDNKPSLFHVSIDWIRESFKHNEWMNEEDFEVGENGKKKPGVSPCPIYIYFLSFVDRVLAVLPPIFARCPIFRNQSSHVANQAEPASHIPEEG